MKRIIIILLIFNSCKSTNALESNISNNDIYYYINNFLNNNDIRYIYKKSCGNLIIKRNNKDLSVLNTSFLYNDKNRMFGYTKDSFSVSNYINISDLEYMKIQNSTVFKFDKKRLNGETTVFNKIVFDRLTSVYDKRRYYYISKPLFSIKKDICIFVYYYFGKYDSDGLIVISKKNKGSWETITTYPYSNGFGLK